MFPSALLLARARKDGVHPVFLGEPMLPQAQAVLHLYQESVGRSRRAIEGKVRELESKVDKYKVVRGLALLVERCCTFVQREGPPPGDVRHRLFDEAKGAAVTPEERRGILARLAPEFGMSAEGLAEHLWGDLEEEEILRSVPALDPGDLLRRFNLGQCQTLLFKATQMSLTFGTPEAYRVAVGHVKRRGLMFTAESPKGGGAPVLQIEGVVSFLRSTERYGTRLAQLLPDLLALPGWSMVAKVLYRDSFGRKRHLDFRLDRGMADYLDVPPGDLVVAAFPSVLEVLAVSAERAGFQVERSPPPLAVGAGLEYPDLTLTREGRSVFVEAVGYWSSAWLEKKLQRTEGAPGPYVVLAPKDLAVTAGMEHPRLRIPKRAELSLGDLKDLLPAVERPREPPRRDLTAETLVIPAESVVAVAITVVAGSNRIPTAQARELLEERGFLCAGGFALRREALPQIRERVRSALPDLTDVERALQTWGLSPAVLPALGFQVRWKGLEDAVVVER